MRIAWCLAVLLAPTLAVANEATATDRPPETAARDNESMSIGLSVNPPPRWVESGTFAVSAYVGFAKQHAVRLNYATYTYDPGALANLFETITGDGREWSRDGRTNDFGVAWQYYSHGWFRGFTLEAGVLRRTIATHAYDAAASPQMREIDATGYGGVVLFGWTWLFARHGFFSTGIGISLGRYTGVETTMADGDPQLMREHFARVEAHGEMYMRFGIAFGR